MFVAEPVPEVMYRLEYRYLEYGNQEATEWATFTTSDNYDHIQDAIVWIALHLIAETRVSEYEPTPQWESVSIHSKYASAQNASNQWEALGFWTKVIIRYHGYSVNTNELELSFPAGF